MTKATAPDRCRSQAKCTRTQHLHTKYRYRYLYYVGSSMDRLQRAIDIVVLFACNPILCWYPLWIYIDICSRCLIFSCHCSHWSCSCSFYTVSHRCPPPPPSSSNCFEPPQCLFQDLMTDFSFKLGNRATINQLLLRLPLGADGGAEGGGLCIDSRRLGWVGLKLTD